MTDGVKVAKRLERHFKGVANHWRIEILLAVAKNPDITLEGLWTSLGGNEKTISEHTKKLLNAGLIDKRYQGTSVLHTLSPYGKLFCDMIGKLQ